MMFSEGYNALVLVCPLLFQIINEAGDFPVELHHHPENERRVDLQAAVVTWCRTAPGDLVSVLRTHKALLGPTLNSYTIKI